MTNYNDRDTYDREIHQRREVHQSDDHRSPNQVIHTSETVTQRETPLAHNVAYRDAYNQGRLSERQINEYNQIQRDNDNAGRGLLIGIAFTALAAMLVGAFFLLNQKNQAPVLIQRVIPSPSPSVSPSPQVRERIIERDQVVPVPQTPPQVNITVPDSSQSTTPQQAPAQQAAPSDTSGLQNSPSNSTQSGSVNSSGSPNTGTGQ